MAKEKRTCNWCFKQMDNFKFIDRNRTITFITEVCVNPACPSYSLYQVPMEQMPKENKRGKKA